MIHNISKSEVEVVIKSGESEVRFRRDADGLWLMTHWYRPNHETSPIDITPLVHIIRAQDEE